MAAGRMKKVAQISGWRRQCQAIRWIMGMARHKAEMMAGDKLGGDGGGGHGRLGGGDGKEGMGAWNHGSGMGGGLGDQAREEGAAVCGCGWPCDDRSSMEEERGMMGVARLAIMAATWVDRVVFGKEMGMREGGDVEGRERWHGPWHWQHGDGEVAWGREQRWSAAMGGTAVAMKRGGNMAVGRMKKVADGWILGW